MCGPLHTSAAFPTRILYDNVDRTGNPNLSLPMRMQDTLNLICTQFSFREQDGPWVELKEGFLGICLAQLF
jgi:hypothetical protein